MDFVNSNNDYESVVCPECGDVDVAVQVIDSESITHHYGPTFFQRLINFCRWAVLFPLGAGLYVYYGSYKILFVVVFVQILLWFLIPAQYGYSKQSVYHSKIGVCQECGHSWFIDGMYLDGIDNVDDYFDDDGEEIEPSE